MLRVSQPRPPQGAASFCQSRQERDPFPAQNPLRYISCILNCSGDEPLTPKPQPLSQNTPASSYPPPGTSPSPFQVVPDLVDSPRPSYIPTSWQAQYHI